MSEKQLDSIEEKISDIKEKMSDDFHNHLKDNGVNWKEYKKKDKSKYDRELNDFVNEHVKKYVPMYQKALNPYNMEVTFI